MALGQSPLSAPVISKWLVNSGLQLRGYPRALIQNERRPLNNKEVYLWSCALSLNFLKYCAQDAVFYNKTSRISAVSKYIWCFTLNISLLDNLYSRFNLIFGGGYYHCLLNFFKILFSYDFMNKDNSEFSKYTETSWHQWKSQKIKRQRAFRWGRSFHHLLLLSKE